ncbi:hypothetical protein AB6C47_018040 [Vibrio cyclitrophicus]
MILKENEIKQLSQRAKGTLSFTNEKDYERTWIGEITGFLNHKRVSELGYIPPNSNINKTFDFYCDDDNRITIKLLRRCNYEGKVEQKEKKIVFPEKSTRALLAIFENHLESVAKSYNKAQNRREERITNFNHSEYDSLMGSVKRTSRRTKLGISAMRKETECLLSSVDDCGFYEKNKSTNINCIDDIRHFTYRERFENVSDKINKLFRDCNGLKCEEIYHYQFVQKSVSLMF